MEGRLRLVTSEYLLAEVDRTLREPEVRALRSLSDAQIDAFVTVFGTWLPWLRDATTWLSSRVTRLTTRCSRVPSRGCRLRGDGRPQAPPAAQGREARRSRCRPDRQPGRLRASPSPSEAAVTHCSLVTAVRASGVPTASA